MGAGSSTLYLQKGDTYAARAKAARKLSDDILTVFFNTADFRDILELSSLSACPKYVFTTAEALQTLFDKISVSPKLGKKGEILFAPLTRLAPGFGGKSGDAKAQQELLKQRDTMCMDIAYFYVRTFQIYGALAFTTLDADPRRFLAYAPVRAVANPLKGPSSAVFVGGGGGNPLSLQSGGNMYRGTSGPQAQWKAKFANTPLAAMLKYFSFMIQKEGNAPPYFFQLDDPEKAKRPGSFYIKLEDQFIKSTDEITLPTVYEFKDPKSRVESETITFKKVSPTTINVIFDGETYPFILNISSQWEISSKDFGSIDAAEKDFRDEVHDTFENLRNSSEITQAPRARIGGPAGGPARVTAGVGSGGKSTFEGFDSLKKLLEDRSNNKEFPKAYCVAKAMVLLNPLFEDEKKRNPYQPYVSQVCKRNYDFENLPDMLPRPGRQPKANAYLKSLVALYYDGYQVKSEGTVEFIQTETGRSELREASKDLAALYNVTKDPETFIESTTEFKQFPICARAGVTGDVNLYVRDDNLRRQIQNDVVRPMLQFQQDHTERVNKLLKRMFEVKQTKDGKLSMTFTKELKSGGIESVNKFAREARDMLLKYYLKSEAYFIRGTLLLESGIVGGKVRPVP